MHLFIRHTTRYRYSHPARYTIQYLRLTPRTDSSQRVGRWQIGAPGRLTQQTDAFGNILHVLVVDGIHDELAITVEGEVDSLDTVGVVRSEGEPLSPLVYLRPTPLTEPTGAIPELAARVRARIAADRLDGLHELTRQVAGAVAYRPGSTGVETTAASALAACSGVCQDQAHVFIAAARLLGVPTRYVSGYVHVAGEGADETASHAWSESWVEGLGWVAFDVTNLVSANDAHVRVAVGPDYAACAPVRGVRRGGGAEDLYVQVRVAAMDQ